MYKIIQRRFFAFYKSGKLTTNKFHWGRGFGAFSVSELQVQNAVEYIKNQEVHHRGKSFSEEYQLFLKKYNIVVNG